MGVDRRGSRRTLKRFFNEMDDARFGAAVGAIAATGVLTAASQPSAADTVTIGARTYTFRASLSSGGLPGEVLISAVNASGTLDNLIAAINGSAGEGTTYGTGTTANPEVSAAAGAGDTIDLTARTAGALGNAIVTTETAAQLSFARTTLNGGGSCLAVEKGGAGFRSTKLVLDSFPVRMTDEAGVALYGGAKLYDFQQGAVNILSARADLNVVKSSVSNTEIIAAFDGDFGVGTVTASNNATLATTEQNVIPTTATPQASAGATVADGLMATVPGILGDASTAIDLFLNALVDDADQNVGTTHAWLYFTGVIQFNWIDCGDV